MSRSLNRTNRVAAGTWTGLFLTGIAALIIGCGGGGNDTSITGTTAISGVTASSATSVTATATTTTATTTTATTTTSTTATGTTAGTLPPNVIFYVDSPDQTTGGTVTNYNYVTPAGTGNTVVASLTPNFASIALNSANQTKYFAYTADPNNPSFGIYSNTTYSVTGATTIVAPSNANPYVAVGGMQVSPDGTTLYYLAAIGSNEGQIFSVPIAANSTPTALDFAYDSFQLNPAGTQLAYGKLISNEIQLFTRAVASTSTPVQITNNAAYSSDEPQWNKTGTLLAFTADPGEASGNFQNFVFTMNPNGTSVTQVTNTANQDDHFPSFSGAGTQLAFMSLTGGAANLSGFYTVSLGGATDLNRKEIVVDQSPLGGVYWTSATGRGAAKSWSYINTWSKKRFLARLAKIKRAG